MTTYIPTTTQKTRKVKTISTSNLNLLDQCYYLIESLLEFYPHSARIHDSTGIYPLTKLCQIQSQIIMHFNDHNDDINNKDNDTNHKKIVKVLLEEEKHDNLWKILLKCSPIQAFLQILEHGNTLEYDFLVCQIMPRLLSLNELNVLLRQIPWIIQLLQW